MTISTLHQLLSVLSRLPLSYKRFILAVFFTTAGSAAYYYYYHHHRHHQLQKKRQEARTPSPALNLGASSSAGKKHHHSVGVNAKFVRQLCRILPILVPDPLSRESGLLILLTVILIIRTYLDIWFSSFNARVIRSIVSADKVMFVNNAFILFGIMMWPMSIVNNSLKIVISLLSTCFRTRLTRYVHRRYLQDMVYYRLLNLDSRIPHPDHVVAQDIEKFADFLTHLYTDLTKPIVDIILFATRLGESIGKSAPIFMMLYFGLSGAFLRAISPPFGKFTAQEQKVEGDFRYCHGRIVTHAEEIAFYGGHQQEEIIHHVLRVLKYRFFNGVIDSIFVKYFATMMAYYLLSRPIFSMSSHKEPSLAPSKQDANEIMENFSRSSSYLVSISQAVGRIVLAGRDLTRFAGYTSRVAEFIDVLEQVRKGHWERGSITRPEEQASTGRVIEQDDVIEFDNVPIMTPSGDVLVESISFRITSGMNCIVTGPNGCGKSSLFRILGDLWPLQGGTLTRPKRSDMFYVPQRPYLSIGHLRDQVIYPDNPEEASKKGYSDKELLNLLKIVKLEYLVEREGGWEAIQDWADVLSGGEKQRIAMARLFYHQPQFAILDECTSAVSVDVEGIMYRYAKKYHDYLLKFDGDGGFEFAELSSGDDPFVDMKRAALIGSH